MAKQWKQWQTFIWGGSKVTADGDCSYEIKRRLLLGRKVMTNLDSIFFFIVLFFIFYFFLNFKIFNSYMHSHRQHIKKQRYYFANKGLSSQGYGFSSSYVWMWELDHKEGWALKNWCFWIVVIEKTLTDPLDCKEIQPVHSEGDQSWVFSGRSYVEAETPILWSPDEKSWLIGKDSDAKKDWGQEEKGMTEEEMVGWHHPLNGHEFV